jgi:hypothetical protein
MQRIVFVSVLVIALMASLLVGCADKELTQEDLEQRVNDVLVTNAEVETCRFDMDTLTTIETIGGPDSGEGIMTGHGFGVIDSANKRMQMVLDMDISIPERDKQTMSMESHIDGGWMYVKMNIPDEEEKQFQMKMPDDMWNKQSQLEQQARLLRTAEEVVSLGIGTVDGISCYVIEIVPAADFLDEFLSQIEMPEIEDVEQLDLNFRDLVEEMSFKQWIAKDSYLILRSATQVLMEFVPEDVGATEDDFERITMNQTTEMSFYDFNEAVSIEIPEEVK